MISKTININSVVRNEDNTRDIIHMTCNIDTNLNYFNISANIIDKELYAQNTELLQTKFKEFLNQSLEEAVASGWTMVDLKTKLK